MIDLLLATDHDIDISENDLQLVEGSEQISQNLKIRLLFFAGEWYLDTNMGVPYYSDIFLKSPNVQHVDSVFKSVILDVKGVLDLLAYESNFDPRLRKFTINFTANTSEGVVTISETL